MYAVEQQNLCLNINSVAKPKNQREKKAFSSPTNI